MPVDFIALFALLDTARLRYVVFGGLAVLLHGVDRLTADVDLVIDLATDEAGKALRILAAAGYRPLAPVDRSEHLDPAQRAAWQRDRGMKVFSFWDSTQARPTLDIFIEPPIDFETLWRDAPVVTLGSQAVRIASVDHLIGMKLQAGRPQDLADVERLRALGQPGR